MPKVSNKQRSMALYQSILELRDLDECCAFFDDLCTVGELRALEQRYDVAILLDEGMVYTDILEKTGASSATISRVNRIFSFGAGGFRRMIQRRKQREEPGHGGG
ncbi:MAG TPA: TrpR-like protein [Candidatus Enterenecus merdae]|nr:TrpR-like protein [Candidatus Enterenecus merdae]